MILPRAIFLFCICIYLCLGTLGARAAAQPPSDQTSRLFGNYCLDCHDADSAKGDLNLEALLDGTLASHADDWERVVRQLDARQMPPVGKDRPSGSEYESTVSSLASLLDRNAARHPMPGRTETFRRLNRSEYQNAIRDLLALEVDAKMLLPPDPSSHGFDNVTVGDLPPALLNRYISAAQKISRLALGTTGKKPDGRTIRIRPDITQDGHMEGLPLGTRGGTSIRHLFPRDGEYEIRIRLMRDRDEKVEGLSGRTAHTLQVLLDGGVSASFRVRPPENPRDHTKVDAHLVARIEARAGARDLGVTFVAPPPELAETLRQPYEAAFNVHRHPRRAPAVYQVSITGPFDPGGVGDTESRRRLSGNVSARDEAGARKILRALLRRAYRGHADQADLARAMKFYREGSALTGGKGNDGFDAGIESALSAILVSPKFLFRVELDPGGVAPGAPYNVDGFDLASRLSFFLWSSIPDDALLDSAAAGELDTPGGIAKQARRMLADPRSNALVENFASQWLYLRNLDSITPDGRLFPDFDDNLRQAMRRETELLFSSVLREDRSVLELLRSDRTFLNERLAKHYGVPHVYGERFRPVALDSNSGRGGILRHASILTVTSYAHRTSPVLRGHWVMENVLGTPPPPPPANVPPLEDNTVDQSLPVRDRFAVHREQKACAQCHDVMDPIGFAFENFDAVGRWRTREGETFVDATGTLPDGTPFDGIAGLEDGLLKRPELFVRTLTEKLLTYALGRGVESSDAPAVRKIVRGAALDDYRFSEIIVQIVTSDPFIMRMSL